MYSTRGRTAVTVNTANHAITTLWNPHATQIIKAMGFKLIKQGGAGTAGDAITLRRISARGTPGSTVTPAREAHSTYGVAPVSGALLDLAAFSVQPTLVAGDMGFSWVAPAVLAAPIVGVLASGIQIPAGTGLAIIQVAATVWPISDVQWDWLEDWQ